MESAGMRMLADALTRSHIQKLENRIKELELELTEYREREANRLKGFNDALDDKPFEMNSLDYVDGYRSGKRAKNIL